MAQPHRGFLRAVRRGEVPLADVVDRLDGDEARLLELRTSAGVPDQPD